jgi:23S rRNA pseudouridine2604 synthase
MAELGLASRREADDWIVRGWVRVDGEVVDVLGSKVTADQRITIDNEAKAKQDEFLTIVLNKPVGYVSGHPEFGQRAAASLVAPDNRWDGDHSGVTFPLGRSRRLVPAGRLDLDSDGLLVLTEDGRVARRLIGDRGDDGSPFDKEYVVHVSARRDALSPERALSLLHYGLRLDGRQLLPAIVEREPGDADALRFVLREGRNRQIRRMCDLVGLDVIGLQRVRIGLVMLGALPVGRWRALGPGERFENDHFEGGQSESGRIETDPLERSAAVRDERARGSDPSSRSVRGGRSRTRRVPPR